MFWRNKIKKKYNIAVCLYGHMRTFEFCAPFLHKNLLRYSSYDLFIHSWTKLNHNTQTWYDGEKHLNTHELSRDQVFNAYGEIKNLSIEEQKIEDLGYTRPCGLDNDKLSNKKGGDVAQANISLDANDDCFSNVPVTGGFSISGLKSLFHSMSSAILLAKEHAYKNAIDYDYIIVTRPDIWFKKPFIIDTLLAKFSTEQLEHSVVAVASNAKCLATNKLESSNQVTAWLIDTLFLAQPEVMFKFIEHKDYILNKVIAKEIKLVGPESIFMAILQRAEYKHLILPLTYNRDFVIQRFD